MLCLLSNAKAKGILTTLRRKIALLEILLKDIIAKLKLTQRLLTWPNSLFISISSIALYLFSNAKILGYKTPNEVWNENL